VCVRSDEGCRNGGGGVDGAALARSGGPRFLCAQKGGGEGVAGKKYGVGVLRELSEKERAIGRGL
jgi:hypothetical protein